MDDASETPQPSPTTTHPNGQVRSQDSPSLPTSQAIAEDTPSSAPKQP
ncbi:hypothetical protein [Halomicronema hongdechloris]|nr:hypothetical protein [Halomicronema hongdechloris]